MNKITIRAGDDERVIMKGLQCGTILLHDTIENQEQKGFKKFSVKQLAVYYTQHEYFLLSD